MFQANTKAEIQEENKDYTENLFEVLNTLVQLPNNLDDISSKIIELHMTGVIDDFQFQILQNDLCQLFTGSKNLASTAKAIERIKN
jgi:hypothetical protein